MKIKIEEYGYWLHRILEWDTTECFYDDRGFCLAHARPDEIGECPTIKARKFIDLVDADIEEQRKAAGV